VNRRVGEGQLWGTDEPSVEEYLLLGWHQPDHVFDPVLNHDLFWILISRFALFIIVSPLDHL
jgi:hypothetical protein